MINYDQALALIAGIKLDLRTERLPLIECTGRELAQALTARIPSPPYTNAAMDGFAIKHADGGANLDITASVFARPVTAAEMPPYQAGSCVRIMTGGYLPEWADTVVPTEDSLVENNKVRFLKLPDKGANIRHKGEDIEAGSPLLKTSTRLDAERLMVCAAFGYDKLDVIERPRLALLSTGDELIEPGTDLPVGAVYDSSKFFLAAAAAQTGLPVLPHQRILDDEAAASKAIMQLLDEGKPTVIVSTGAVSAGDADFIPKLGASLGFEALFHKVAIRPGKPVYLARQGHCVWVGLPGNPVSTCVGWHMFVRPLLASLANIPPPERKQVKLSNEVRKPEHLRCFYRAELSGDKAWVARRQGSAHFAATITAEAYIELPEGTTRFPVDSKVTAILI